MVKEMVYYVLLLLIAGYSLLSTSFFGWTLLPNSFEELVTDGIVLILFFIAVVVLELESIKRRL
jgi:uncharacterized membrane protein